MANLIVKIQRVTLFSAHLSFKFAYKNFRMNKWVQLTLVLIAVALIIYNSTVLDFEDITYGDSGIALIGIFCSLIGIVLVLILRLSKKVEERIDK